MNEDELPEGWEEQPLGELLEPGGLFDGPFGSNLKTSDYTTSGVRVIRLENLSNLRFNEDKQTFISKEKYQALKKHSVIEGDIIFGSFVDAATRVTMLPKLDTPAIAKADCFCIRPRVKIIDPRFLTFQLGTGRTRAALIGDIHGATRPRITTRQLRVLPISIPPLAEQKRIVAKVEELLASVNAARDRLARISTVLKRFRHAVLAAACSGDLTEEWRSTHPATPTGTAGQDGDLPALPESWRWTLVREIGVVQGGIQKQPKREPRKHAYPYLRVANVLRDRLDLSRVEKMELFGDELETYRLSRGDLLVVEGNGSPSEIGRSAMWTGEIPDCVHQNHIIRVRPTGCDPRFLNLYWNSPLGSDRISQVAVTTAGLYNLSTKKIASLPVPLPPQAEQIEIVRRVKRMVDVARVIEKKVADGSGAAEKLTQSVLAKAFSGELVSLEVVQPS